MMLLVMMAMRAIIESCDADVNCNTLESSMHTHTHQSKCSLRYDVFERQSLRIHRFRTVSVQTWC